MKYLENLITETNISKVKGNLLLLQQFCEDTDEDKQKFIDAMLLICGKNKDKQDNNHMRIGIGRVIDEGIFESMLGSVIHNPIAVVSRYGNEPQITIKDGNVAVVTFNLVDVEIRSMAITEVVVTEQGEKILHYLFFLHSLHNNIDYNVGITVKEAS